MLTGLWEVKMDYAMSYGGMTYHGTFYVSGDDVATATQRAVAYMQKSKRFNTEILSIRKTSDSYFESSVD